MAYLPDAPNSCRWFTAEQKMVAAARVPVLEHEGHSLGKILSMFKNPVFVVFGLLNMITLCASYGLLAFLPAIIVELGYSSLEANLRTSAVYLWQFTFTLIIGFLSDRWQEKGWILVGCFAFSAACMFLLAASIQLAWPSFVQYALCFGVISYAPALPLMMAWLQTAYRTASDAAIGPALVLMLGSIGGLLGPNIYGISATGGDTDPADVDVGHLLDSLADGTSFFMGHLIMGGVLTAGALLVCVMRRVLQPDRDGVLMCRLNCFRNKETRPLLATPSSQYYD